jgi:hypothetical protein
VNVSPVDPWAIKLTPNSFTVQQIQTDVDSLTRELVRSLLSFQEWTECFHIFIAIYIQKYPEEAPLLLKYMSTIKEIHEMKGVVTFHYYDLRFRDLRKGNRHPWHCTIVAGDSLTLLSCISMLSTN